MLQVNPETNINISSFSLSRHGNTHIESDITPPLDALKQASSTEGER